jgi:hypothetical protein
MKDDWNQRTIINIVESGVKHHNPNPLHVVQSNRSVTELYQSCFITCLLLIIGGLESLSYINQVRKSHERN